MKYTYEDFKDKTKEGIDKELGEGLAVAAFYFYQTLGVPVEIFNDWITTKLHNKAEQLLWYMNFRNDNLKLFR